VELPGIEPGAKIALSWENAESDYANRREMTCGYAKSVDGINLLDIAIVGVAGDTAAVTGETWDTRELAVRRAVAADPRTVRLCSI
jgi:hypothetical protein